MLLTLPLSKQGTSGVTLQPACAWASHHYSSACMALTNAAQVHVRYVRSTATGAPTAGYRHFRRPSRWSGHSIQFSVACESLAMHDDLSAGQCAVLMYPTGMCESGSCSAGAQQ